MREEVAERCSAWREHAPLVAVVAVVCILYYFVRTRFFRPFRPERVSISAQSAEGFSRRVEQMKQRAEREEEFSEQELDVMVRSLQYAAGNFKEEIVYSRDFELLEEDSEDEEEHVDWMCIRGLIQRAACKSHKDWVATENAADLLMDSICTPSTSSFCCNLLHRVLNDGGWWAAELYAEKRIALHNSRNSDSTGPTLRRRRVNLASISDSYIEKKTSNSYRPWVVVICGINGIRKTTSVYQPWFQELLHSALGAQFNEKVEDLPDGSNSFFRQLDYLVATVACEDFRELYNIAGVSRIGEYSAMKDAIFARYRTLAEMIGVLLLKEAREKSMNVMIETSGKDISSFQFIDHLFPNNSDSCRNDRRYNKLIVNFSINDIKFAKVSVDERMRKEVNDGIRAVKDNLKHNSDVVRNVISVNSGGPYGSEVLCEVQEKSDKVMKHLFANGSDDGEDFADWFKARIQIIASDEKWCACSLSPSGLELERYTFENR